MEAWLPVRQRSHRATEGGSGETRSHASNKIVKLEAWLSGRKHLTANEVTAKSGSEVRILPPPKLNGVKLRGRSFATACET